MSKHDTVLERLAGELMRALLERSPTLVLQTADACLAWAPGAGPETVMQERREVLAAVAAQARHRYACGHRTASPAEMVLLTGLLAR